MKYNIFGLTISVDIPFTCLKTITNDLDVDVRIVYDRPPENVSIPTESTPMTACLDGVFFYRLSNGTEFTVIDGNKIYVYVPDFNDIESAQLYVLGSCMGVILMQRGIIPMHGSAISYNGKGIIVVGESGAGKSSFVNFMISKGAKLISDDVIPIINKDGVYYAQSSYPTQKIAKDLIDHLGLDSSQMVKVPYLSGNRQKYTIDRSAVFNSGLHQIDYIVNLVALSQSNIEYKKLTSGRKIEVFLNNMYREFMIPWFDLQHHSLSIAVGISQQAEFFKMIRPEMGYTLEEQWQLVDKNCSKD